MIDLVSYALWAAVCILAYVHCPFLQRTGKNVWAVASALCGLIRVMIQHQLNRLRCRYAKYMYKPLECASNPTNKPAANVVMRRPCGGATEMTSPLRHRIQSQGREQESEQSDIVEAATQTTESTQPTERESTQDVTL